MNAFPGSDNDNTENEEPLYDYDKIERKRRRRNEKSWKKNNVKILKYSGKAHVSLSGKEVEERRLGPDCRLVFVLQW